MIGTVESPLGWNRWPKVKALLAKSIEAAGDSTLEDVETALSDYTVAQLWSGGDADLVGVTQIYPGQCYIWHLAGDFPKWGGPMFEALEKWARAEGCKEIEFTGRRGWLVRLPDWYVRRMNKGSVTMYKVL